LLLVVAWPLKSSPSSSVEEKLGSVPDWLNCDPGGDGGLGGFGGAASLSGPLVLWEDEEEEEEEEEDAEEDDRFEEEEEVEGE
jgi:hypothetical protein